jgi:SAM-dependent methyltransferase
LKPEQLIELKRDLERLFSAQTRAQLAAGVVHLFEKYELAATIKRRRGCQTPPVPLASDSAPPRDYLSGHRSYTGRPLWLSAGGSDDLAWCPALNALVWKSTWWSSGDNYHRIREESGGSVKVQTPERLLQNLIHRREHLRVCWTPEERESLESAAEADQISALELWPDERYGILSSRDLRTLRPTDRFSERVENYVRYRPGYPGELIDLMRAEMGLGPGAAVADVGSGTGILTKLLLREGAVVYGVEPNRGMREAAERWLSDEPGFRSIEGSAEATTLPDESVDFVTAGQAFHWFDAPRANAEFRRIMRPNGHAVIVWNDRRTDTTPFLRAFEQLLLRFGIDYILVAEKYALSSVESERALREFFGGSYRTARFDNRQSLDFDGLKGRLLSASYVPLAGQEGHEEMLAELARIFAEHQQDAQVTIEYDTNVFYGPLK